MLKRTALAALFTLCVFPAAAWDAPDEEHNYSPACTAPIAPASVDGASATRQQIDAAHDAVNAFVSASDSYQRCLGRALGAQQDMAFFAKTNVPVAVVKQIEGKVAANQHEKEKAGNGFNAAAAAFRAKNGKP